MSVRAQIPAVEGVKDDRVATILGAIKAAIENITGRTPHRPQIKQLGPNVSLGGTINKVNEVIRRLQDEDVGNPPAPIAKTPPAVQVFLGGDVSLNNNSNYFDICNTGLIGDAGQLWRIDGVACVLDTAGAATFKVRIWDGTTVFYETEVTTAGANLSIAIPAIAIVTPASPTIYYLSVKDLTANTGVVKTSGVPGGTSNRATTIVAVKQP